MSIINNSGWILCPSKRFPGKFYYYNVTNGESAWSFNETEKKFLRIDDKTQHVSQKSHRYPEPPGLPYRSQSGFTKNTVAQQPFGHAIFPKYVCSSTLKCTTNPNQKSKLIKMTKPTMQRNMDSQTFLSGRDIVVESRREPLSKRFSYLCKQNLDNDESQASTDMENIYHLTKPLQTIGKSKDLQIEKKSIVNSTLFNREDKTNVIKSDKERNLNLPENDLRYVLRAKRFTFTTVKADSTSKTSKESNIKYKKKVTFNIPHDEDESSSEFERDNRKVIFTKPLTLKKENNVPNYENCVKNCTSNESHTYAHTNLFLRSPEEFDSFLFMKKENNTTLARSKKRTEKNETWTDSVNNNDQYLYYRHNGDQIASEDDISDLILNVREKLHIKNRVVTAPENSRNQNFGSYYQETPFRIAKSNANFEPITSSNKSNIVVSLYNSKKSNKSFEFENVSHRVIENRKIVLNASKLNFTKRHLFSSFSNDSKNTAKHCLKHEIPNVERKNCNTKCGIINLNKYRETDIIETTENVIDEKLRKFYIKNKFVEKSVIQRMDELICCFTQILEDFVCKITETSACPPPCSLYDGLFRVKSRYSRQATVSFLVDRITDFRIFSHKTGYIQNKVEPQELIKAIACGILFIEAFKELNVDTGKARDAGDAGDALSQLLRDVEDPQYEELAEPIVGAARESDTERLINFMKSRADIVRYLQDHFPEWQSCDTQTEEQVEAEKNVNTNILRASGKDLHRLKINNQNHMYIEEADKETKEQEGVENCHTKIVRNFQIIDKFEQRLHEESISIISYNNNESNNLYFDEYKNETDYKEFSEFSTNKENYKQLNELCTDGILHSNNYNDLEIDNENDKTNKSLKLNDSKHLDITENKSVAEKDEISVCNETQCSVDNLAPTEVSREDAEQYYLLVKTFLIDLSSTLQLIYAFIEENIQRFYNGDVSESNRKLLNEETNNTYTYLKDVIEKLKSIIERESGDEHALRSLVAAADGAAGDRRVLRYRQVVSKCLEQARLMESSLKLMLHLMDDACTLSVDSDRGGASYINIFE